MSGCLKKKMEFVTLLLFVQIVEYSLVVNIYVCKYKIVLIWVCKLRFWHYFDLKHHNYDSVTVFCHHDKTIVTKTTDWKVYLLIYCTLPYSSTCIPGGVFPFAATLYFHSATFEVNIVLLLNLFDDLRYKLLCTLPQSTFGFNLSSVIGLQKHCFGSDNQWNAEYGIRLLILQYV